MPLLQSLMAVVPARAWLWSLLRNGGYCEPDLLHCLGQGLSLQWERGASDL